MPDTLRVPRSAGAAAETTARLRAVRLVPVITIDDPGSAVELARALSAGGLPSAEITFRTPAAAESLARIADAFPEMLLGAGTVLSVRQVKEAREAGAHFAVAPGFNPRVVDACLEQGLPVYPGVCTPSEVEAALEKGLTVLKFFPAEQAGGVGFLRAIAAPYTSVEFMPTGGIGPANLAEYLAFERVVACGGSWMAPQGWIRAREFDRIREETERAVRTVRTLSGEG